MYQLEVETEADSWEVEALYDLCFAPGRTALSSYRLRDEGVIAGVIRYWPIHVGRHDALLLGPVTRQGEGRGAF